MSSEQNSTVGIPTVTIEPAARVLFEACTQIVQLYRRGGKSDALAFEEARRFAETFQRSQARRPEAAEFEAVQDRVAAIMGAR